VIRKIKRTEWPETKAGSENRPHLKLGYNADREAALLSRLQRFFGQALHRDEARAEKLLERVAHFRRNSLHEFVERRECFRRWLVGRVGDGGRDRPHDFATVARFREKCRLGGFVRPVRRLGAVGRRDVTPILRDRGNRFIYL
jgi:hypothetical protein